MRRKCLLFAAAFLLTLGANAQADVTSQYISNATFESCTAVQPNASGWVEVINHWNTLAGTDYADQGWSLVEQRKGGNGAVIEYGSKIKYGSYSQDENPTVALPGTTGNKALCFSGSKAVTYVSTDEVTLPAGSYKLTVNVYTAMLATTGHTDTYKLWNTTGFVASDGTEYLSTKDTFISDAWDTDVIEILLTKETKGHFQLNYGSSYYILIDDLKLEYENKIITTDLEAVLVKAKALNEAMGGNNEILLDVISSAESFIANPTSQDEVAIRVQQAYDGMAAALTETPLSAPVNLNVSYLENASFESGVVSPWEWGSNSGTVSEPTNTESKPYIDGKNIVEFTTNGSNSLTQTLAHLPAGYYILDTKLNQNATLSLGGSEAACVGGTDALYLRVHTPALNFAGGELNVSIKGTKSYRVDDFRLFYSKDESQLLPIVYAKAKAEMQAILDDEQFAVITGSERDDLQYTINMAGENYDELMGAMYEAATAFIAAKSDYKKFEDAKTAAAAYSQEDYPYASDEIFQQIQTLMASTATSAANAVSLKEQLDAACFKYYVSNAYCEGVENTDYTANILGANATADATGWAAQNMAVRSDKTGWNNPKTGETDAVVYGVTSDYYRASANTASILKQTIKNLPAGDYVLSMTMMGSNSLPVYVFFNGELIGTMTGVGTYGGGKYGAGWNEYVFPFTKADDTDMPIQLQCKPEANYKEWYVDNFRLFKLESEVEDENTYGIVGDFSSWDDDLMLTKGEGNVYTLTVDDFEVKEVKTFEYKVRANEEWGGYELPASGSDPANLSWTPEKSGIYTLTFTFNRDENTCVLSAERTDDCTWTVYFVNNGEWDKVFAYTWTNGSDDQNAEWPGVELALDGERYVYSVKAENAPAHIIFNNGDTEAMVQTEDLEFVDGQEYSYVMIPAEITSVALSGAWNGWSTTDEMTSDVENVYTMELDLANVDGDQTFKLLVNGGGDESDNWAGWMGNNQVEIEAPEGWITSADETTGSNLQLNHSITGYSTYAVTATWTPNPLYYQGWKLSFEGRTSTGIQETMNYELRTMNCFDLQGRRTSGQLKKGLYIVDGKKVVMK